MPYIILNYWEPDYATLAIVTDEEGNPLLFDSNEYARDYAEKELNFSWAIVEL